MNAFNKSMKNISEKRSFEENLFHYILIFIFLGSFEENLFHKSNVQSYSTTFKSLTENKNSRVLGRAVRGASQESREDRML